MTLLDVEDDIDKSLVIMPSRFANIGRFFNGINNHDEKAQEKVNLRTMRCQFETDGTCHVLMYTSQLIKKGQEITFDYNLGCQGKNLQYDTSQFI